MGAPWWAHFEFTRKNIELTILSKKIEDLREEQASGTQVCRKELRTCERASFRRGNRASGARIKAAR
jgi:hypothetical protein